MTIHHQHICQQWGFHVHYVNSQECDHPPIHPPMVIQLQSEALFVRYINFWEHDHPTMVVTENKTVWDFLCLLHKLLGMQPSNHSRTNYINLCGACSGSPPTTPSICWFIVYAAIILISNYHNVAIYSYHLELSATGPWLSNHPTARGCII